MSKYRDKRQVAKSKRQKVEMLSNKIAFIAAFNPLIEILTNKGNVNDPSVKIVKLDNNNLTSSHENPIQNPHRPYAKWFIA